MSAQERNLNQCGSFVSTQQVLEDRFFGNSEGIIDILNQNGFEIPRDYLDNLDTDGQYIGDLNSRTSSFETSNTFPVPVKANIYRNNDGTGNISEAQVYQIIDNLNILVASTGFEFYLLCDITVVNNSTWTNDGHGHVDTIVQDNRQSNVLNVNFIINSNNRWAGKAKFPWDGVSKNYSLIVSGSYLDDNEGLAQVPFASRVPILAHEIGHTFGLYHTHQARNGLFTSFTDNGGCGDCNQESVSRTKKQGLGCALTTFNKKKCAVNGDLLCDTPADPSLLTANITTACNYNQGHTDNWGAVWTPDENNIMSYSNSSCLNYFSPLQIGKMILYYNLLYTNHQAISISGNDYMCAGSISTYQANTSQNVSNFTWTTSSNYTILSGQGTSTVTLQSNNDNNGFVNVSTNCGHKETRKSIEASFLIDVDGATNVCPETNHSYSTENLIGATYNWTVSSGTIISGQGSSSALIQIAAHPSYESVVTVGINNYCNYNTSASFLVDIYNPGPGDPPCVNNGGNDDRSSNNIILYPNPAKDFVNINILDNNNYVLEVYDINGIKIKQTARENQNKIIETTIWKEGIYIFKFSNNEISFFKKLILKK